MTGGGLNITPEGATGNVFGLVVSVGSELLCGKRQEESDHISTLHVRQGQTLWKNDAPVRVPCPSAGPSPRRSQPADRRWARLTRPPDPPLPPNCATAARACSLVAVVLWSPDVAPSGAEQCCL